VQRRGRARGAGDPVRPARCAVAAPGRGGCARDRVPHGQTAAWIRFYDAASFHTHLYAITFYMLTGLHAAHVLGGIGALAVVLVRAWRGDYGWAWFPGVRHLATYWHFLGVVWLVLFATLWIGG
jgi:heme/copper-type cytochrome/quinol oxidase subunit 3